MRARLLPVEEIAARGAVVVRLARDARGRRRTELLAELAGLIVEFRRHFPASGGGIDWKGRSWEYREAVRGLFDRWGIPSDSDAALQASVRYHVGNRIREMLSREELDAAGLLHASPRERLRHAREMLRAASAQDGFGEPGNVGQAIQMLQATVVALGEHVTDEAFDKGDLLELVELRNELDDVILSALQNV